MGMPTHRTPASCMSLLRRIAVGLLVCSATAVVTVASGGAAHALSGISPCVSGAIVTDQPERVTLTWPRVGDATGYTITPIGPGWARRANTEISRGPVGGTVIGGLTPGVEYEFIVRVERASGTLTCSVGTGTIAAGGVFAGISSSAAPTIDETGSGVHVSWPSTIFPAGTADGTKQVRVYVESTTAGGIVDHSSVGVTGGSTEVTIPGLAADSTHQFYIQPVVNDGGLSYGPVSAGSAAIAVSQQVTPGRADMVSVQTDGSDLSAAWTYSGVPLTSQRVIVVLFDGAVPYVNSFAVPAGRRTFTTTSAAIGSAPAGWDGTFNAETAVVVRGVNAVGVGRYTPLMFATEPTLDAVGSLTAIGDPTSGTIDVTWTRPTGLVPVSEYEISVFGPTWAWGDGIVRTTAAQGTRIGGLTPGVTYNLTVRAIGPSGGGPISFATVTVGESICERVFYAPAADRVDDVTARISWQPSTGCVDGVTGWRLFVTRDDGATGDRYTLYSRYLPADATSVDLGGFDAGVSYSFTIVALRNGAPGVASLTGSYDIAAILGQ